MKRIFSCITLLLFATAVWGGEYWIQVLSIDAKSEMGGAFKKRLESVGHPYETVEESGLKKVRIGSFPNYAAARKFLRSARCKVATDAFIVEERPIPMVEQVPDALVVVQQGNKTMKKAEAVPVSETPPQKEETVTVAENRAEDEAPVVAAPCTCICDKHALRKAEIATALSFYRSSPHYRFDASESGW